MTRIQTGDRRLFAHKSPATSFLLATSATRHLFAAFLRCKRPKCAHNRKEARRRFCQFFRLHVGKICLFACNGDLKNGIFTQKSLFLLVIRIFASRHGNFFVSHDACGRVFCARAASHFCASRRPFARIVSQRNLLRAPLAHRGARFRVGRNSSNCQVARGAARILDLRLRAAARGKRQISAVVDRWAGGGGCGGGGSGGGGGAPMIVEL